MRLALTALKLVFLSYSHGDAIPAANKLREDLQRAGCAVWLDRDQILPGQSWTRAIERAIDKSDVVLVLLTPGAYRSDFVRAEVLRAQRRGKRIVPVHIAGDVPLPLEGLQMVTPERAVSALGCSAILPEALAAKTR